MCSWSRSSPWCPLSASGLRSSWVSRSRVARVQRRRWIRPAAQEALLRRRRRALPLPGRFLANASGRSTAAAIDADLWTPLGLERFADQDEQTPTEPIAAPGEDKEVPGKQSGRPFLPYRSAASALAASQGVAGDAASTARWGYALYGGQGLSADSVAQMIDFDQGDDVGRYGLGTIDFTSPRWFRWHIEGYGMRGAMPGYRSVLAVYPEHHLSVAILTPSTVDVLPYVRCLVNAGSLLQ